MPDEDESILREIRSGDKKRACGIDAALGRYGLADFASGRPATMRSLWECLWENDAGRLNVQPARARP
jgi:hypothetical protein